MRTYLLSVAWGTGVFFCTTAVFAANNPPQGDHSSPLTWITLFLPTAIIATVIYGVLRSQRSNQSKVERSVEQFDEHRRFTEEHMRRVESQMDRLDERLSQVIELLTSIERSQRADRS